MKTLLSVVVATLLAFSWVNPAAAQTLMTGNLLLEHAASAKKVEAGTGAGVDFQRNALLHGFALGVVMTLRAFDSQTCVPQGSNAGQYVKVLTQYLEANPAELHKDGTTLAIAAFRKAFPCR